MSYNLKVFGVSKRDAGYIYLIENKGLYKIGKSIRPEKRLREAKTWLPDMNIIGIKPFWNVSIIERQMHEGFAHCWYANEWFSLFDEGYEDLLLNDFSAFSDNDRDKNSVDFIYWFNGSGMLELGMARSYHGISLTKFLANETCIMRHKESNS